MKILLAPVAALVLALTAIGCKNTSPAVYALTTSTLVSYGLRNSPDTANYLRAIQPVACSAASGENLSPDQILAAIEASGVAGSSPEGQLIVNGVLLAYIAAFDSLGDNTNAAAASPYARAVFCDGFSMGLAGAPSLRSRNAPPAKTWWPLLKK